MQSIITNFKHISSVVCINGIKGNERESRDSLTKCFDSLTSSLSSYTTTPMVCMLMVRPPKHNYIIYCWTLFKRQHRRSARNKMFFEKKKKRKKLRERSLIGLFYFYFYLSLHADIFASRFIFIFLNRFKDNPYVVLFEWHEAWPNTQVPYNIK